MRLQVRSQALFSGLTIWRGHEQWCRSQALLWLWQRLVGTAPIRSLAWAPPYAAGALEKTKKKKKVWFNFYIFSTLACAFKDLCHSPTLENSQLLSLQILPLHYSLKALFQKYLLDMSDLFILSPAFLELFHIFYFLISLC